MSDVETDIAHKSMVVIHISLLWELIPSLVYKVQAVSISIDA